MASDEGSPAWAGGELLFAGGTDWAMLGKSANKSGGKQKEGSGEINRQERYPNLPEPHRLKSLVGVRVMFIAAGPAAAHAIIGDAAGVCYTWGRNDRGQLGHGDQLQRNVPTPVKALSASFVTAGAGGRHHTAIVTKSGESFAWGLNQQGQCGTGAIKKSKANVEDVLLSPSKVLVEGATAVTCGVDFTLWLCNGRVFAAGNPQYGQLGDGDDHSYNAKDSSIQIKYEPQPTPRQIGASSTAPDAAARRAGLSGQVAGLADKTITRVVAGHNHAIAVDDAGCAYTWGNGNYGKLGHKVQQDEFAPRVIEAFKGRITVPADAVIAAGGTASFATVSAGQLYGWGKLKASGDSTTYPNPMYDLQGWNIRSMSCGPGTYAIAADRSVITWGAATNGELAYGADGKKSSANPDKCSPMDDMHTQQVACGVGFSLFLVAPDEPKLASTKVFEPAIESEPAMGAVSLTGDESGAGGAKRKAPAGGGKAKKAK